MVLLGMLLSAGGWFLSVALYDTVQGQRRERIADQAETFRTICQRQETTDIRLIEQKRHAMVLAETLQQLLRDVSNGQRPQDTEYQRRGLRAIRATDERLSDQIAGIRQGIMKLQAGIETLDCNRLPSNKPFDPQR